MQIPGLFLWVKQMLKRNVDGLLQSLSQAGVNTVFGYPGGCIMPLYDALVDSPIEHVLCRHEQGAAFAAQGFARSSNQLGVCIATSGPGASNLVTAIADAFADSIAVLFITGQVPTGLMGRDSFQELDMVGMSIGCCKYAYQLRADDDISEVVQRAIHIAQQGRPGPVLIDLPKDLQMQEYRCNDTKNSITRRPAQELKNELQDRPRASIKDIQQCNGYLQQANKPLLYLGGGIRMGAAVELMRDYAQRSQLPSVCSLQGLGCVENSLSLGMLGMHGSAAANAAVQKCDLLIILGARLDDRATGAIEKFAPAATIIHIDIDSAELNKQKPVQLAVHADLATFIPNLAEPSDIDSWRMHCRHLNQQCGFSAQALQAGPKLIQHLSEQADQNSIVCCDVGQHQMWVAQYFNIQHPMQHLSSGGLGTMGFGLPAAIGAAFAHPDKTIIVVTGDGSIFMNLQELATITRYQLNIKICLLDNNGLGMVRQQQNLFYQGQHSQIQLHDVCDLGVIARGFGFDCLQVNADAAAITLDVQIKRLLLSPGPVFLHARVPVENAVWPTVVPGEGNHQMIKAYQHA